MFEIFEDSPRRNSLTLSLCCDTGAEKGLRMRGGQHLWKWKWCPSGAIRPTPDRYSFNDNVFTRTN